MPAKAGIQSMLKSRNLQINPLPANPTRFDTPNGSTIIMVVAMETLFECAIRDTAGNGPNPIFQGDGCGGPKTECSFDEYSAGRIH